MAPIYLAIVKANGQRGAIRFINYYFFEHLSLPFLIIRRKQEEFFAFLSQKNLIIFLYTCDGYLIVNYLRKYL
jgi:hypothetical protein